MKLTPEPIRCTWCGTDPLYMKYHDKEWGKPVYDDQTLFEFLVLESAQAGLSWIIILRKRESYRKAFAGFDIQKIASFTEDDVECLMLDSGIIRNRLKINAAIHNALVIVELQKEFGSFKKWIDHHHPKTKDEWVKIFKKTFKFTGGEIVNEFLMSTGYLEGAHIETCLTYKRIEKMKPRWLVNHSPF